MGRELHVALRARLTWLVAAAAALLVGHGFVLAMDLFSSSSRSAIASVLQAREMDPLAGVVRPALGGADLAISLFMPLVAARVLSIEKERRTLGALCILEGSSTTVVMKKLAAAAVATGTVLIAPCVLFFAYRLEGGHVDVLETGVALGGEALHLALVTAVGIAAAAWTATLAQAATLGIVVSITSWAIDAADGFAALAWLGGASAWSVEQRLEPFQRGVVSLGSLAWLVVATVTAIALAVVGARFDLRHSHRLAAAFAILAGGALLLASTARIRRGYDWSEQRRASLPPAVVNALRAVAQPIQVDVLLDRDDSRRRQLEADVLSKLSRARPDLVVRTPLDADAAVAEGKRDDDYGRILITVGGARRVTRSTSRREIVTLVFEAAGVAVPEWTTPVYAGYPHTVEGGRRALLLGLSYSGMPILLLTIGHLLTRRRLVR